MSEPLDLAIEITSTCACPSPSHGVVPAVVSNDDSPPPLGLILGIIIGVDLVIVVWLGSRGILQRMPEWMQFYYGLMMFGFPVLAYWLLKKRRDRRP